MTTERQWDLLNAMQKMFGRKLSHFNFVRVRFLLPTYQRKMSTYIPYFRYLLIKCSNPDTKLMKQFQKTMVAFYKVMTKKNAQLRHFEFRCIYIPLSTIHYRTRSRTLLPFTLIQSIAVVALEKKNRICRMMGTIENVANSGSTLSVLGLFISRPFMYSNTMRHKPTSPKRMPICGSSRITQLFMDSSIWLSHEANRL